VIVPDQITLQMQKIAAHLATSWEVISDHDRYLQYLQRTLPLEIIFQENYQVLYGLRDAYNELLGFANTPGIFTKTSTLLMTPRLWTPWKRRLRRCGGAAGCVRGTRLVHHVTVELVGAAPHQGHPESVHPVARSVSRTSQFTLGSPCRNHHRSHARRRIPPRHHLVRAILVREGLVVRQGLSSDDFVRILVRFVCEERLAVGTERPKPFSDW
jgi:hypothetical protein